MPAMTAPTPPIELTGSGERFTGDVAPLPAALLDRLSAICETITDTGRVAEASRDWWPLALHWSLTGMVPRLAGAVARPTSTSEVAAVLAACDEARIPVTAAGGRSGVSGASVPLYGGVVLDTTALVGIGTVDVASGVVEVAAGTFGPDLESELRAEHGLTIGHFPQSFDLATVGGWVACRGAGQYSTRYGKIEDMVVGLEVVLADGTVIRTGGGPASAVGPDLNQLFTGSEGTLGIVTRVWLRAHPLPVAERRAAYSVATFGAAVEACRTTLRRGATPAVLRCTTRRRRRAGGVATARTASSSCSTKVIQPLSTPRWRWSPSRVRRSEPRRRTTSSSPIGSYTATTPQPSRI